MSVLTILTSAPLQGPKRGVGRPKKVEIPTAHVVGDNYPAQDNDPAQADDIPKKKRGRPKKEPFLGPNGAGKPQTSPALAIVNEDLPKKKPGRPKKEPPTALNGTETTMDTTAQAPVDDDEPKRKPGRPMQQQALGGNVPKKGRGRPPKNPVAVVQEMEEGKMVGMTQTVKPDVMIGKLVSRPRGRPKKTTNEVELVQRAGFVEKLQVSFSESESEESTSLGGPVAGVPVAAACKEPLINTFNESFDEDSDN